MTTLPEAHPAPSRRLRLGTIRSGLGEATLVRYALYMYVASRVLYLAIAAVSLFVVDVVGAHSGLSHAVNWQGLPLNHSTLGSELSNWDGRWYLLTSETWYYHHVVRAAGAYTTLGFMPLYPMAMWLVAHATRIGALGAGLTVSMLGGGVATVLIAQLAREWWGEPVARRSIAFWCFFPGTVVFSMVYSEGLMLSLISGSMLMLTRRRWLWAGVLAGFATAVGPVALSAVPMCVAAALMELRRLGWRDSQARRALIAPLLSPLGAIGFAIYLWIWTGSPLSDYTAQHIEWSESTTPLAIPRVVITLAREIFVAGAGGKGPGGIDLNGVLALFGTAFLLFALKLLWDNRSSVPLIAWVWTSCVCILALTSAKTPPNPRLLIVAFPLVIVIGMALGDRSYLRAMRCNLLTTVLLTPMTYVGLWLRP